jgi:hypothetical protein
MAGFCHSVFGLQTPNLTHYVAKSSKVSGTFLKHSRFRETVAGDWVRSALRGRASSEFDQISYHRHVTLRC